MQVRKIVVVDHLQALSSGPAQSRNVDSATGHHHDRKHATGYAAGEHYEISRHLSNQADDWNHHARRRPEILVRQSDVRARRVSIDDRL